MLRCMTRKLWKPSHVIGAQTKVYDLARGAVEIWYFQLPRIHDA